MMYIATILRQVSEFHVDVIYPLADVRIRRCRYYYTSAEVRVGCR